MQRMFVPILVLVLSVASAAANAQTVASKAAPGTSIPTIAIDNVARHVFFYAGGASAVLSISASGTYHRVYDPCIPKWLNQAGVKIDFVRLETVGISGNSHMMMLEKNSDASIKFIVSWIQKNVQRT